jgi:hypothetical protein
VFAALGVAGASPFRIIPELENCTGTAIQPKGYCVVTIGFTPTAASTQAIGIIRGTAGDGSPVLGQLQAFTTGGLDTLVADPAHLDYGSLNVGATSAAQQVTISSAPSFQEFEPLSSSTVDIMGTPAALPGAISVTTNGIGGFTNQLLMIMPHTPPGHYEIRAATPGATATLAFLVVPGTQEPPKFVNRH